MKQGKQKSQVLGERVKCPDCGKAFTRKGLAGHLMFKHQKEARKVGNMVQQAKPNSADRAEAVFDLVDQMKRIRERRRELEKMDEGGFFSPDEAVKVLLEGLKDLEQEVLTELEALGFEVKKGFFS